MVRCDEFYEKCERDGNFCGLDATAYRRVLAYRDLLRRNPTIVGLTEGAARELIAEKDEKLKPKAIEWAADQISRGNTPTGANMRTFLDNKRAQIAPRTHVRDPVFRSPPPNTPDKYNEKRYDFQEFVPEQEAEEADVGKPKVSQTEVPAKLPETVKPIEKLPERDEIKTPDIEPELLDNGVPDGLPEMPPIEEELPEIEEEEVSKIDVEAANRAIQRLTENEDALDKTFKEIENVLKKALKRGVVGDRLSDIMDRALKSVLAGDMNDPSTNDAIDEDKQLWKNKEGGENER